MTAPAATRLCLIRHAPVVAPAHLAGRMDVAADVSDVAQAQAVAARCGDVTTRIVSPAQRCQQTAQAIWPSAKWQSDPRLWEQDFGAWEGMAYADLPDLGVMTPDALAAHCPPGGESFAALCDRVRPALHDAWSQGGRVAIVAHAGVIRAALALALGAPPRGLAFAVANWSVTALSSTDGATWAVETVNWTP